MGRKNILIRATLGGHIAQIQLTGLQFPDSMTDKEISKIFQGATLTECTASCEAWEGRNHKCHNRGEIRAVQIA
ncbi:MAG: hypothetical protein GY718_10120 [Lentisphaerae bacterium]|nr:hypothetical protein [Lentisphaerota bacterium]